VEEEEVEVEEAMLPQGQNCFSCGRLRNVELILEIYDHYKI
jgi:hypothetical protein